MSFELLCCPTFKSQFEEILATFPKSAASINKHLSELQNNPRYRDTDLYPGFGQLIVIKARISLSEYKFSAREGLRFIFLVNREKNVIVPILIFKKGEFKKEHQVISKVKENLKMLLAEIETGKCVKSGFCREPPV